MTDEFLRACHDEQNEIGVELEMLADGQLLTATEEARVLRIRQLRRVASRLAALVAELEAAAQP